MNRATANIFRISVVEETGRFPGGSFGGDPCKAIFGAFETVYRDRNHTRGQTDTTVIPVAFIPNLGGLAANSSHNPPGFRTLVATTDTSHLQQIDLETLEPIELFDYNAINNELPTGSSASHPGFGLNGEIYNYLLDTKTRSPTYDIYEVDAQGGSKILAKITDAPPAYIHSLIATENYVVFTVWQADLGSPNPPTFNIVGALKPWDASREAIFYVISKKDGGVVAKYTTPPFFAFHHVNAFEDKDGSVVLDLGTYPDLHIVTETFKLENMRNNIGIPTNTTANDVPSTFTRYRLPSPMKAATTTPAILEFQLDYEHFNLELPRINEKFHAFDYQYAYGVHVEKRGFFSDSLIKIDVKKKTKKVWTPKVNSIVSEPVFIARPGAVKEDDGVLLTVVMDSERVLSSVVALSAQTMREIARAQLPVVMGYGFHGVWDSAGGSGGYSSGKAGRGFL